MRVYQFHHLRERLQALAARRSRANRTYFACTNNYSELLTNSRKIAAAYAKIDLYEDEGV